MNNLTLILHVFAFACFVIAAAWPPHSGRIVAAGLACWVATTFLT